MVLRPLRKTVALLYLLLVSLFAFAQQDQKKYGMEEVLKRYAGMYADFLSMYSATYAGEHNAELESVQNQFLGKAEDELQNNGFEADLADIRTLLSSFAPGGRLETDLNAFQNETGVKIYLTGLIEGYGGDKIAGMFNTLSKQKHPEEKVAPYLEVLVTQEKDSVSKQYALSVEVIPSEGVNITKAEKYFNKHFNSIYASRREARQHLKGVFMVAFTELKEKLGSQYLPDLAIKYEGTKYRPGDKFEVTQEPEGEITLRAVDKENQPAQDVEWEVLPREGKLLSAEESQMTLLIDEEGYWEVTASNGNDEVTVTVDVVKVPLNKKEILKQLVSSTIRTLQARAKAKTDSLQHEQDSINQAISEQLALVNHRGGLAESTEELVSANIALASTSQPITAAQLEVVKQNENRRKAIKLITFSSGVGKALLFELNTEEYLHSLIDDPENFDRFLTKLEEDMSSIIAELLVGSIRKEDKEKMKGKIIDYLNQKIKELPDEEK
jgi:hypothetical protein